MRDCLTPINFVLYLSTVDGHGGVGHGRSLYHGGGAKTVEGMALVQHDTEFGLLVLLDREILVVSMLKRVEGANPYRPLARQSIGRQQKRAMGIAKAVGYEREAVYHLSVSVEQGGL